MGQDDNLAPGQRPWKPPNEPFHYDRRRVAQLGPIAAALGQLGLPLIRLRKLNGILNAHVRRQYLRRLLHHLRYGALIDIVLSAATGQMNAILMSQSLIDGLLLKSGGDKEAG